MQGTWKQPLPYEHHDRCAEALEIKQVRSSRSIVHHTYHECFINFVSSASLILQVAMLFLARSKILTEPVWREWFSEIAGLVPVAAISNG